MCDSHPSIERSTVCLPAKFALYLVPVSVTLSLPALWCVRLLKLDSRDKNGTLLVTSFSTFYCAINSEVLCTGTCISYCERLGFAIILKVLLTKLFQNDWTTVKISWRKVCFYKKCQILCNSYFRHIFHNKKSLQFSSIVSQNFIHKIVWKCNHNTLNHFLTFSFYLVDYLPWIFPFTLISLGYQFLCFSCYLCWDLHMT